MTIDTRRLWLAAGVLLVLLALGLLIAQAGGDDGQVPTGIPSRSSSASSSDPTPTPSGEKETVRDAYLHQWDVYAKAVRTLENTGLEEVFTGDALEAVKKEIRDLRHDGLGVRVRVKHDLRIQIADASTAVVIDRYENHSIAFDLKTGKATEADPQEIILEAYTLKKVDGAWKVSAIDRQSVRPIKR
jgi:hypothetical protein